MDEDPDALASRTFAAMMANRLGRNAEWESAYKRVLEQGGYVKTWFDGTCMRAEHIPIANARRKA